MSPLAAVIICVVVAFAWPARFDPAIWLKERSEQRRKDADHG